MAVFNDKLKTHCNQPPNPCFTLLPLDKLTSNSIFRSFHITFPNDFFWYLLNLKGPLRQKDALLSVFYS